MNPNYLKRKLGATILAALSDDDVLEIVLNSNGQLWFKTYSRGYIQDGGMSLDDAEVLVHALAQQLQKYLNAETPYLDGILPLSGERLHITIPPVTERPTFMLRKKSQRIYTLEDYVAAQILTSTQATFLRQAIEQRRHILVSGGPGSGKTTLVNALLAAMAEMVPPGHRVVLLEDERELRCQLANTQSMTTSPHVSMNQLLWLAMRNSPDRILVGEVRDGAALQLLKAWNTGCPGGVATIHSNSPKAAVQRVLDLACEVVATPPFQLAAQVLDVIVQMDAVPTHPARRQVRAIAEVVDFDPLTTQFTLHSIDAHGVPHD